MEMHAWVQEVLPHLAALAFDNAGSRYLQAALPLARPALLAQAAAVLAPALLALCTHHAGNFVVQVLVVHGRAGEKAAVAEAVRGKVVQLSLDRYGCRVVQALLEVGGGLVSRSGLDVCRGLGLLWLPSTLWSLCCLVV